MEMLEGTVTSISTSHSLVASGVLGVHQMPAAWDHDRSAPVLAPYIIRRVSHPVHGGVSAVMHEIHQSAQSPESLHLHELAWCALEALLK